ncbi:MAG: urate hydroxylase PuuD [Alphaproteobacteria bacterium]|nr:urate hydroxylase PuuD [Alphaproteobacteria bacterium]
MLDPYLSDWLNLLLRWFHLVIGAAWIGTSFYFNWLNNNVRPPEGDDDEGRVKGELWAVHGGAFYHVRKFRGAPAKLPETLHWFKYEAYFTWISGISLLTVVYYLNARSYLIDPSVADISPLAAVGAGVSAILGGWLVYDQLCKSPLAKRPVALALTGFSLVTLAAWGLSELLSGRAAYIHIGAMLGTCMAANVFFVIIPGQRDMVDAMIKGEPPPVERGAAGSLRSLHNNYLTLPVLFIMVSNHFPMTYGHAFNWAVLAALALGSAGVRHWFNLRGKGEHNVWILPGATVALLALAFVLKPTPAGAGPVPAFAEVQPILAQRCLPCHSAAPTQPGFPVAPQGLMLDDPAQIQAKLDKIHTVVSVTRTMPLGNLTGMTPEERALVGAWVDGGAPME